ncbi:uncharacterized protein [Euwallacea fornicatus]|uniref:uncharacterized protein n=1 Tax=Euwallacea fornicatus TaxID=995702 RepID=UPI0033903C0B
MDKFSKKMKTNRSKNKPIGKKLSFNASSKTSATASSSPVKRAKKQPLGVKKETLDRDDSVCSEDLPTFNTKPIRKKQNLTKTFKKYGVIVPSLEEILAEQKQIREYKKQVQQVMQLKKPNLSALTTLTNERRSDRIRLQVSDAIGLNCLHLTLEQIALYFNKHVSDMKKIIDKKFPSERHKNCCLEKNAVPQNISYLDLEYTSRSMVFTFDQVDHMATLITTHFDSEDISTKHLFQVLIPELCFKIFMDVHKMDKQQAKSFFDKRPVI